ncbi:L-seryl-tRNA(Sec) selenium transferase [candidate division KSB1 bacterium]|nr:L-seryl-tRNA(Sec) selenium transferase [candidate division KSB1 bacterium]RQW07696.1 MAG: L-seryl-tRNA(Sec) selenium transferase [candidate division KSB1 bacterium]
MNEFYHLLPAVDALLSHPTVAPLLSIYQRDVVRRRCRSVLDEIRQHIAQGTAERISSKEEMADAVARLVVARIKADFAPSLRPVINATGIILHTGLGRAPLARAAQENVQRIMAGYANIELEMTSGKRGERIDHVRQLLTELTGAEDALLVNNNAAAVLLALNTLAAGREAIISRGQLVEIGGSFRIPDVMQKSGVLMREVGTTNRTKLSDYADAIDEKTAAIIVAHTSNYRVLGFTAQVALPDIVTLAHQHHLPVLHDLGAGVLLDFRDLGLPYEPLVQDSIAAGVDVITFSGDKVLGGPQAGLIVGVKAWLSRIQQNPIMRAVRCDKLIYAAMQATLQLYFKNDLLQEHAVLKMLAESVDEVQKRAAEILRQLAPQIAGRFDIGIEPCQGQFGSGALPLEKLPSVALVLTPHATTADELAQRLRSGSTPVVGYIQDDRVWLDCRTILAEEGKEVAATLNGLA